MRLPATPLLVPVVDDDAAVRDSLGLLLRTAGYETCGFASAEALLAALPAEAGCVIADVRMPGGMDGVTLVQTLRRRGITLPVVLVSGHGDIPLAVRAMKAGAVDFIEKPYEDTAILGAVATALADHAMPTDAEAVRQVAQLSPREREVLVALVAGQPNKAIAHELGISPRTVEVHRARVMEKLGVRSLSAAVRIGLMAGLVG
ncbi:response regulator transcription factor [Belnapia rosea]|uniref:Two component transcriptional regulator, LuxR family n=1 Tax=Belnapia rosea TaxID=938405 RepID=A0A1G6J7S3_9PROT|nr:response regulator [Belnapia rosea]SDC14679.1 two component transcriptional regulator, LuxR family [Belnapia rosea]